MPSNSVLHANPENHFILSLKQATKKKHFIINDKFNAIGITFIHWNKWKCTLTTCCVQTCTFQDDWTILIQHVKYCDVLKESDRNVI